MLLPRIWDEDLFENMDNWMSWPDESEFFGKKNPLYGKHAKNLPLQRYNQAEEYRTRHHRFFQAVHLVGKKLSCCLPDSLKPVSVSMPM